MQSATPIIFILLIAFVLVRRVQRTVGFQPFVRRRLVTRMVLFAIIGVLVLSAGYLNPLVYVFDAGGAVVGAALAYYAMRTTQFQQRAATWYYRPHPWIGVVLVVVFVGRVVFLMYSDRALFAAHGGTPGPQAGSYSGYASDPAITGILFILVAYYVGYYAFLIRREKHLEIEPSS